MYEVSLEASRLTADKDEAAAYATKVALNITQVCPAELLAQLINKQGEFKAISDAAWLASCDGNEGISGESLKKAMTLVSTKFKEPPYSAKCEIPDFHVDEALAAKDANGDKMIQASL